VVSHFFGRLGRYEPEQPAHLVAYRKALSREDDARMMSGFRNRDESSRAALLSLQMLLFNPVGLSFLRSHARVHLIAVAMVIGQCAIDLCEGEVRIFSRNFLRGHTEFVITHDGPNRYAGPGNVWCAALDAWSAGDQAPDFNWICHNAHVHKMVDSVRPVKGKAETGKVESRQLRSWEIADDR
jgi:hypothetical protein